jgi:hypothetical protein
LPGSGHKNRDGRLWLLINLAICYRMSFEGQSIDAMAATGGNRFS